MPPTAGKNNPGFWVFSGEAIYPSSPFQELMDSMVCRLVFWWVSSSFLRMFLR